MCGGVVQPTVVSYSVALSLETPTGAMVQRLARGPFKAEIRVRFPLALPNNLARIGYRGCAVRVIVPGYNRAIIPRIE